MKNFLDKDFVLDNDAAKRLYHDYAADMPIIDYHCHLDPKEIAENKVFSSMSEVWLGGDHYKWRAMRTNGVDERFCTGDATDWEKFEKWAETVPHTMRNPLYHWTHMELKNAFGIDKLLSPKTAREIYDECNEKLKQPEYTARGLMKKFDVRVVCTTDDPADTLEYHKAIAQDESFDIKVLPTFRPDKSFSVENAEVYNAYVDRLAEASGVEINSYSALLQALENRVEFFHEVGCRLSDHGVESMPLEDYTEAEASAIFDKVRGGASVSAVEAEKIRGAVMHELGKMYHAKGWTQQYHIGAIRNNNSRLFRSLGPDTGFDSIHDVSMARPLSNFFNRLDDSNQLAKTILYNLNPRDNYVLATMIGNYQDGTYPGKMQFGSGWWFLDQKEGMEMQLNALSNLGLLSRFVGMLTDSRSFLSYPRHDYFRRILCNLIGTDIEKGLLPADYDQLGQMVKNISYHNAKDYFKFHEVNQMVNV
ncbi:uronate isomerase (plasmid) [Fulvitalea axinellae]|uniref:Uronate isomerase n=1 Tax=Fulvitalea axinellae TaxID=1182444 RepID=A0AAU9CJ47_9BACT|nr:uronate isomerase [Fulvitalea axinellae]